MEGRTGEPGPEPGPERPERRDHQRRGDKLAQQPSAEHGVDPVMVAPDEDRIEQQAVEPGADGGRTGKADDAEAFDEDRKSTRLNSRHYCASRMPSSA